MSKDRIGLDDHFTYDKLFKFSFPSIVMMVFTSVYGVIDGFFVSNFAGKVPFAAVNLIMPAIVVLGTFGFMFGTGGAALVSMTLGTGNRKRANRLFSMLVETTIIFGVVLSFFSFIFIEDIARLLGATDELLPYCVDYARIGIISATGFALQNVFQSMFVTAEKPKLGLIITVLAGVSNILLDFILVGVLDMGVVGASLATFIAESIGGYVPLLYFSRKNDSLLEFRPIKIEIRPILEACVNGMSELLSNISTSIVSIVYNAQLLKFIGSDGVASFGVMMYVSFVFVAVFLGYAVGTAPIFGYNYGAKNVSELRNLLKKSLIIVFSSGILMTLIAIVLAEPIADLFVGYDKALHDMTVFAFRIFALQFIFAGFNTFITAFFTALNNGLVSGVISLFRVMIFKLSFVMVLPIFFGANGIWAANPLSDFAALLLGAFFLIKEINKNYRKV